MHELSRKTMLRSLTAIALLVPTAALLEARSTDLGPARLVVETKAAYQHGDTLAFRFVGRVPVQSPEPKRLVFQGDLTSLASGDKVGSFTWDLTCNQIIGAPCIRYEVTATFALPEGSLVSRGPAGAVPDHHPGFFLIGIHPEGTSIVDATGAFAGRSGRAHMSGRHGGQDFPNFRFLPGSTRLRTVLSSRLSLRQARNPPVATTSLR